MRWRRGLSVRVGNDNNKEVYIGREREKFRQGRGALQPKVYTRMNYFWHYHLLFVSISMF